jgi:hypothetical protein
MSKESFAELVRVVGPLITKKDTNCRWSIGVGERLLIMLCKAKYLFMTVYLKLHVFDYLQTVLTFIMLRIFRQLIIINTDIFLSPPQIVFCTKNRLLPLQCVCCHHLAFAMPVPNWSPRNQHFRLRNRDREGSRD